MSGLEQVRDRIQSEAQSLHRVLNRSDSGPRVQRRLDHLQVQLRKAFDHCMKDTASQSSTTTCPESNNFQVRPHVVCCFDCAYPSEANKWRAPLSTSHDKDLSGAASRAGHVQPRSARSCEESRAETDGRWEGQLAFNAVSRGLDRPCGVQVRWRHLLGTPKSHSCGCPSDTPPASKRSIFEVQQPLYSATAHSPQLHHTLALFPHLNCCRI